MSFDLTGRRFVCDNESLQFECEANNVARIIWTGPGYIGRDSGEIYFGSDEYVNAQKQKGSATAILTRNIKLSGGRSNLTSRLTIMANSSIRNGWVECRTDRGQSDSMQILVTGEEITQCQ